MVCISANIAVATADASSKAIAGGKDLSVGGNIIVYNRANSVANIQVDNLTVSVVSVGVNSGTSVAKGDFEAGLESRGNISVTGTVSVTNDWYSLANAALTPALGGVTITLATVDINAAVAYNRTYASAYILGNVNQASGVCGQIRALSVNVQVNGEGYANATVNTPVLAASAVSVTANAAIAKLTARQEAYLSNAVVTASSVSVTAQFNAGKTRGATATLGGNGASGSVNMDKNGTLTAAQTVMAYIAERTNVVAVGSVGVTSRSNASVEAVMKKGLDLGAVIISKATVQTVARTDVRAYVGDGATVTAGKNITVSATDYISENTKVDGTSAGLLYSANGKYATNNAVQRVLVTIGNAALRAGGSLSVLATADVNMTAKTTVTSLGLVSDGTLQA